MMLCSWLCSWQCMFRGYWPWTLTDLWTTWEIPQSTSDTMLGKNRGQFTRLDQQTKHNKDYSGWKPKSHITNSKNEDMLPQEAHNTRRNNDYYRNSRPLSLIVFSRVSVTIWLECTCWSWRKPQQLSFMNKYLTNNTLCHFVTISPYSSFSSLSHSKTNF